MMGEQGALIRANWEMVCARIGVAAAHAGRSPEGIRIIAVTKGHPANLARLAYAQGIRDFGENRVEEALPKLEALSDLEEAHWHMIGHIQSRKASAVVAAFEMVHSVDSLKLARRLDRFASENGVILPILIECNVSGEPSKHGWEAADSVSWDRALPEIETLNSLDNLTVRGLMTMAPWTKNEQILRRTFIRLRELRDFLDRMVPGDWQELSMGMSNDYEIAVEEGATMVRLGTAIFGPR